MGARPYDGPPDIELEKLISDSLYLDNQAHAVVARMRDMDSGTKSQLRRLYNAVRRAVRAPESERQHHFVMLRARLAYTIARHSLRSLDALERLLLQVTRRNDAHGYERFKDLFGKPSSLITSRLITRIIQRVNDPMSTHTAQTQLKLVGKLILSGELHCETGLHIGAGKGSLEIGGADNPVVKDAFGLPYIPGSSLRGKVRSLLENALGLTSPAELVYLSKRKGQEVRIHQSDRPDDEICLLFGRSPGRMERVQGDALESKSASPARLTVYDAPLDLDSITPQMRENLDDEITEVKSENAIDRITSQANPRTLERVPAGARFRVRMVLDVLCEEDKALAARLPIEGLLAGTWRTMRWAAEGPAAAAGFASRISRWRGATGRFIIPAARRPNWPPGRIYRKCTRWPTTARLRRSWRKDLSCRATWIWLWGGSSWTRLSRLGGRLRTGRSAPLRNCDSVTDGKDHMPAGLLIRLRPTGPWRIGPDSGDRDRVERIYHSDTLYSAVSRARDGSPGNHGGVAGRHGARA